MASRSRATISANREKYSTKWLKNAMKSVGTSAQDVLKELSPNMYEVASAGTRAGKSIASGVGRGKSNTNIGDQIRNNKYVNIANTAYNNAIADIKSGNLNNQQRLQEVMMGDIGEDFDDLSDGFSFGDGASDSPENVNINYVNDNTDALQSISDQMSTQAQANVKMQKASMDAYIAVSSANMQQASQIGTEILSQLNDMNSNLAALVQYNNETMSRFIESSISYYEKSGARLDEESYSGSNKLTASDVFNNSKGGINIGQYKEYVKQQLKDSKDNSTAGMISSMIDDDMLNMAAANPIGFLTTGAVKYMMPKVLKTSIESMEATFSNFLPNVLSQIADWSNEAGNDYASKIKRLIGQTFGIKNERVDSLNGAKVNREAIPFDGETKHAITEVITKELRDQTGYLQIIANQFDPNAKSNVRKNAEYWDWNNSAYINRTQVDENIANEIIDSIQGAFSGTKFGESMQNLVNQQDTKAAQDEMDRSIRELYTEIEKQKSNIGLEDLLRIISVTGASDNTKRLIKSYVSSMAANDPNSFNSLNTARLRSQTDANDAKRRIMDDPTSYNLYSSSFAINDKDLDTILSEVMGHGNNANARNRYVRGMKGAQVDQAQDNGLAGGLLSSFTNNVIGAMNSAMKGGGVNALFEGASNLISEQAKIIGTKFKTTLFGEKNNDGNSVGGIFSDVKNQVRDNFKEIGNNVKDGVMEKLFGKTRDENGNYTSSGNGRSGLIGSITGSIRSGVNGWIDAFFGKEGDSDPDSTREETKTRIVDTLKKSLPDGITGGAIGAGVGMIAGNSIFGMLVGGPMGGAVMGAATGFLKKNEKFQNWLFGEKDDDGNRVGGIISQKTQEFFKENKKFLTGSAVVGTATGAITGGGLLGSLVGGPVAGALMGVAGGIVSKSSMFNKFLFGDDELGQKGIFQAVSDAFNKHSKGGNGEKLANGGKAVGMGVIGAAAGGMSAALLGKMGIIGASMTPLGPVGGALIGLGASIKAQSGNFRQWLFGEEDGLDINGKKAKKQGIVGQLGNMINANLIRPIKTNATKILKETELTIQHNILEPVSFFAEMVADKAGSFVSGIQESIGGVFNGIGKKIHDGFSAALEPAIQGFTNAVNGVSDFAFKTLNNMISLPGNLIKMGIEASGIKAKIEKVTEPFIKLADDVRSVLFTGIGKLFNVAFKGVGLLAKGITYPFRFVGGLAAAGLNSVTNKVKDKLGEKYTDFMTGDKMDDFRERFSRARHNSKVDKEQLRKEVGELKRHDKNAKFIAKYTKNQYSEDTDEAREYLKMVRPDKYRALIEGESEGTGWKSGFGGSSKDEEARQAKIDTEGSGTFGMSEAQLSSANPAKLNEEGKQTYFLQGIFNILRGKRWDGENKDNPNDSDPYDGMTYSEKEKAKNKEKANERVTEDNANNDSSEIRDQGSDVAGGPGGVKQYLHRRAEEFKSFWGGNNEQGNVFSRAGGYFKEQGSDILNKFKNLNITKSLVNKLPKHAEGGIASGGAAIVGENGPEIIETNVGDVIHPTEILKSGLNKLTGRDKNQEALKKAIDDGKTAKEAQEEKEKQEQKEREEEAIKIARETKDATVEHKTNWASMFGKKGLITAGALLVFTWLKKHAPDILNAISGIGKFLANFVGDTLENMGKQFSWTNENSALSNGETTSERLNKNLSNENIILDENGDWGHQSGSHTKFLARTGLNIATSATHLPFESKATKATKYVAQGVKNGAKAIADSKAVSTVGSKIASTAKNIGSKITMKAATDDGLLSKVCKYFTSFFDTMAEKLSKKTGKTLTSASLFSKLKPTAFIDTIKSGWTGICTKIETITAGRVSATAASAGLAEVAFAAIGAINGVSGTAQLFHVDSDSVDGTMRLISGIIGALTGTTVGSILDVIFELIYDVTGVDILNSVATAMYNAIVGDDKEAKLADAQDAFKDAYLDYQDDEISQQYETQKAAGIIGTDVSYEDFKAGVSDGTYNASYMSFADYNTDQNKSIGDKIGSGLSKVGKGIKTGAQKIFGSKNKTYTDSNGNTYIKNADGNYDVTDSSGNKLGSISKDAIPENATVSSEKTEGLLSKAGKSVSSALGSAVKSLTMTNQIFKDYIKGDSDSIDFGISEDDSSYSMIHLVECVAEKALVIPRFLTKAGTVIGKLIGFAGKTVIEAVPKITSGMSSYIKGESDEIDLQVNDELPSATLFHGVERVIEFSVAPIKMAYSLFKKISSTVKNFVSTGINTASSIVSGAIPYIKGQTDDITIELPDDNPLSGVTGLLSGVTKFVSTPFRLIKSTFDSIGNFVHTSLDAVGDIGSSAISEASSYIKGETDTISLALSDDNPLRGLTNILSKTLMFVSTPFRMFKQALSGLSNVASGLFSGVSNFASFVTTALDTKDVDESNYWASPVTNPDGIGDILQNSLFFLIRTFNAPGYYLSKALEKIKDKVTSSFKWILDLAGIETDSSSDSEGGNGTGIKRGGGGDTLNGHSYFSQNDSRWKNKSYNTGEDDATFGDTGCGPTAMAMAVSDLGGNGKVDPQKMGELAKITGNRDETGTNWNFINDASNAMGIPSRQAISPSASYIDSELESGNPVILSGVKGGSGLESPYTNAGHYVVAVGKDNNGNVIINDPRGRQYSGKYNLADVAAETGSSWSLGGRGNRRSRFISIKGGRGKSSDGSNTFTAADVIRVAKSQVGYSEKASNSNLESFSGNAGTANYTKYGVLTGTNGQPWCASFVCWCFYTAANKDKSKATDVLAGSFSAACTTNMNAFMKQNRFTKSNPQPGDVVFFGNTSTSNHTGIVISVTGDKITTIEGNTSPGKFNNDGGCVAEKTYSVNESRIAGYGRPKFDGSSSFNGDIGDGEASVDGDGTSTTKQSAWDKLSSGLTSFFSEFATKAMSGDYTTDFSFGKTSNSDSSSTSESSSNISGNGNTEKVWNYLKGKGLNDYAVAGLMGNLKAESGINPTNLQDSYESSLGLSDSKYTSAVDSGQYGNFSNDSAGYGLAQWTSSGRKKKLLELAKKKNTSIGDIGTQLDHLWNELSGSYNSSVLTPLKEASSLQQASNVVLHKFEAPADQSAAVEAKRASYGKEYYSKYGGAGEGVRIKGNGTGGRGLQATVEYKDIVSSQHSDSSVNYYKADRAQSLKNEKDSQNMSSLLVKAVELLADIASNTSDTSTKLNALKQLKQLSGNNNGNTSIIYQTGSESDSNSEPVEVNDKVSKRNDLIAYQIAKGGY